jgi:thiol-disulfide isomerase/thioredoxin
LFTNKLHAAGTVIECDVVNISDRKIEMWQSDTNYIKKILFSEIIKGSKRFTIKFMINKPTVIFFNDYLFYVHPEDTIKLFYRRLYSTGYDSLSVQGKNAPYYLFFYELIRRRSNLNYDFKYFSDSLWFDYKDQLQNNRRQEVNFLNEFAKQYHLSQEFYLIAYTEIKYQYIINCLLPNYGLGFNKNVSTKIPKSFYDDLSDKDFCNNVFSNTYITALDLYDKYLTDNQTGQKFSRYSGEYLAALYNMANKVFKGTSQKLLLLRILNEYQVIGLETYLSVYIKISEEIRGKYPYPQTLNFVDSLYSLFVVLNKPFPKAIKNALLTDLNKKQISFGDIIDRYRGKVIYGDFWATWCIPCIHEMPNSVLMQKKFEGKDLVFVFFSLDSPNSITLLTKVSSKLKVKKNQYIVNNGFESELSNYIGVGAIPAHFIVDKQGNLAWKSAPGPNTQEANKIINQLLLK